MYSAWLGEAGHPVFLSCLWHSVEGAGVVQRNQPHPEAALPHKSFESVPDWKQDSKKMEFKPSQSLPLPGLAARSVMIFINTISFPQT